MRLMLLAVLLAALPAEAVELSLIKTNITMPASRTFQMPLTANDAGGRPLTFSVVSTKPGKILTTSISTAATNRSIVINVSGVDSNTAPFTGDLVLQLFEDLTPLTAARIIDLVSSNFYNGQPIERVVPDFVCEPHNTNHLSGVKVDDEFVRTLTYTGFGQLGMANGGDDTGDSDFFITDVDLSIDDPARHPPRHLDFDYTLFGQMTRGFDTLDKIMNTAVTNEAPIVQPIINSITVLSNSQDAVLHIASLGSFTGTVAVTVAAMNNLHETATQTFQVKIIANTVNDKAFLGPVPSSLLITQSMAATFIVTASEIDPNESLNLSLNDAVTHNFPTNLTASFFPSTSRVWFIPNLTVTGDVNLVFGVTDNVFIHGYDTQHFTITVVPKSDTPTMTILPKTGSINSSVTSNADRIKLVGTLTFTGNSDHTFDFRDIILLNIGDPGTPLALNLPPDLAGRKTKNGVVKFKSAKGDSPFITAQFNAPKGTFKIAISNFNLPADISNDVEVAITVGNDYGADTRAWTLKKPGVFAFPKP